MGNELAERKNDNKLRWRNFPLFLMRPLAEVGQFGEGKYSMYNFLKGGEQNQYLDAIKRHLDKYEDPTLPDVDHESGVSHLAHVAWNALVGMYMMANYPELDDRFKLHLEDDVINDIPNELKEFLDNKGLLEDYIINHLAEKEHGCDGLDISDIRTAFVWDFTEQGHVFWKSIAEAYIYASRE